MLSRTRREPVLTVQVDVDGLKNLRRFYGFEVSATYEDDSAYRLALPRFAELFKELGIQATFFVIGEDLDRSRNSEIVRQLHEAGHEIANHTQTHHYNFIRLSRRQKYDEIERAGQAIEAVTGQKPVGFRAPGYDVDPDVLNILAELQYGYDSSVMPSLLNLPAKLAHLLLSKNGKFTGYGSLGISFAPNRPYLPDLKTLWRSTDTSAVWEIPVSCVPYVRLPFYANFNLFAGKALFRLSARLAAGMDCNYVFHAIEMLEPSEIESCLHRHPNARLPLAQKISRCRSFLQALLKRRRVLLTREFVTELCSAQLTANTPRVM